MRSIKEIKQDYRFTPEDERRLAGLRPLMEEHAEEIMSTVSLWFKGTKGAAKFFTEETLQQHVFASQKDWFLLLFSGKYDNSYYDKLIKIGMAHMRKSVVSPAPSDMASTGMCAWRIACSKWALTPPSASAASEAAAPSVACVSWGAGPIDACCWVIVLTT